MTSIRILGDWGSTRLRLWCLQDNAIVDRRDGPGIVGLLRPAAEVLGDAIAPWLGAAQPRRIALCGMAGARGGLAEVSYVECPAAAANWVKCSAETNLRGIPVRIAAGFATSRDADAPDDIMRGEETQIFGALAEKPELRAGLHVFVLPGTHSKWVTVEDGRITAIRTFPTGELFALLQSSSLLAAPANDFQDDQGFADGLSRTISGSRLLGSLFEARAAQLRRGHSPAWATNFLSGLLIGSEIGEMRAQSRLPSRLQLIGDPALVARYSEALTTDGVVCDLLDGDTCSLSGLRMLDADD